MSVPKQSMTLGESFVADMLRRVARDVSSQKDEAIQSELMDKLGIMPPAKALKEHGEFIKFQGDPNDYFAWKGEILLGFRPLESSTVFDEKTQSHKCTVNQPVWRYEK